MSTDSRRQILKAIRERRYLNKDFEGFRNDLVEYAKAYFPNKIQDLTANSVGGLLIELAAYIGDVQSFYLDHQFHELSPETAVEEQNIERLLRDNGVPIVGAAAAVVDVRFSIKVPVQPGTSPASPEPTSLPIINAGTTAKANNGTSFELIEDLDFNKKDNAGNYIAEIVIADRDGNDNPTSFIMSLIGVCISGQRATETFSVTNFENFKRCTLANENVTQIISVRDSTGKDYYEVEFLTQDIVFKSTINKGADNELVQNNLEIIPAPYRFTKETSLRTNLTTLIFGGGNAETLDDDIVPDPSQFAIPLYGKTTFSRYTLNPSNLLRTGTLGVLTPNSTLTVQYRYGGGLSHNIEAGTLRGVDSLLVTFPNNPTASMAAFVRQNIDAINDTPASGGDDAPTLDDLKAKIPEYRSAQSRIVNKEDILARVYTMPANFGRVFRAAILPNPNNPNAASLYIICRNASNQLAIAPDSLKKNLSRFLNQYRLISDAIDILDAQVINLKIQYSIVVEPQYNKQLILQNINGKLGEYFNVKNFEIGQPLIISDIQNIIYNNTGVVSVQSVRVENITGTVGTNSYSNSIFDVTSNTFNGIIFPPTGALFEIKYKKQDIIGTALA